MRKPPLSLALSPDRDVQALAAESRPGAPSKRAEDTGSLASGEKEKESAASERSSCDNNV